MTNVRTAQVTACGKLQTQGKVKPLQADNQYFKTKNSLENSGVFPLSLDTIAQPVHDKGLIYLKKKAKNQYFSKELARHLSILDSPLNKSYRRTLFDCGAMLIQEGYKLTSRYCNARWCNTCNRIRTAKLINGYRKPLEAFTEPYFVTLTIPNVKKESLEISLKTMLKTIQLIVRSRRRLTTMNGIRKLECTYNAIEDSYHPHLHFIVDGEDNAKFLISEWLNRNETAEHWCQDYRKADESTLMELFKYTTKIVSKAGKDFQIYIQPLDVIFQAMHKVRTFQPFGSVRMVSEDIDDVKADSYDIPFYESVVWEWTGNDWQSMLTGETLTGYQPSKRMIELTTEKMIV